MIRIENEMNRKISLKKTACIIAAVLIIICLINRNLIWTIGCNMFSPKTKVGETFEWPGGTYERLQYGESKSQYIDLYIPDAAAKGVSEDVLDEAGTGIASDQEKLPLLVIVHGGGFVMNDAQSKQARFMYQYFRDHGFACAGINYRLAEEAPFPGACDDVRDAVHFLTDHADEYGYDAGKIAIFGESAGGYLAAREALTETESDISALVGYYGIYEFETTEDQFAVQKIPGFVRKIANLWIAGDYEGFNSVEEYWLRKAYADWTDQDADDYSVQYIADHTAANPSLKAYMIAGTADITVPFQQTVDLADSLTERYGEDNIKLVLAEGMIHADDRMYSDKQLKEVEQFLREALEIK